MAVLVECVGDDTCELVYIIGWSDCGDECFGRNCCMNILVYMYECGTMFWIEYMYCRICNYRVVLQLQLIFFWCRI